MLANNRFSAGSPASRAAASPSVRVIHRVSL